MNSPKNKGISMIFIIHSGFRKICWAVFVENIVVAFIDLQLVWSEIFTLQVRMSNYSISVTQIWWNPFFKSMLAKIELLDILTYNVKISLRS